MLTKIKLFYYRTKNTLLQLRDVRVAGLMLFLAVVLMISWSGIKAIDTNYQLQREIAQLKDQNELQQLMNDNQRLENGYFDTAQYLELAAREGFGLAAPGESVVIVPTPVALARTVDSPTPKKVSSVASDSRPAYQENFEAWMNFFFHKNTTD